MSNEIIYAVPYNDQCLNIYRGPSQISFITVSEDKIITFNCNGETISVLAGNNKNGVIVPVMNYCFKWTGYTMSLISQMSV